jgi:hypothetical protein
MISAMRFHRKDPMRKDLVGQKFNRLIAQSFSHVDSRGSYFVFLCDCGKTKTILGTWVARGSVKSCGCANTDRNKTFGGNNRLPFGESAFNVLYNNYKRAAERRNFVFELSQQQFKVLTKGNCTYCGIEPTQESKVKESSIYVYNGIDRKDNLIGYTVENTCACCVHCNRAKHSMALNEFLEWLNRIAVFRKSESPANAGE